MDAKSGKRLWAAPLPKRGKGPASSILVDDGRLFLIAGQLTAYDAKSGELLWENDDVRSSNSSPVLALGQAASG